MQLIKEQITEIEAQIIDGAVDVLVEYGKLKDLQSHLNTALLNIEVSAIEQALTYDSKTFEHHGMKFTYNDGRKTYSFKHIPMWSEASEKIKRIEAIAKGAANNNNIAVDEETGEEITPAKISISKPYLSVKLW